jgi:hypothetical protein
MQPGQMQIHAPGLTTTWNPPVVGEHGIHQLARLLRVTNPCDPPGASRGHPVKQRAYNPPAVEFRLESTGGFITGRLVLRQPDLLVQDLRITQRRQCKSTGQPASGCRTSVELTRHAVSSARNSPASLEQARLYVLPRVKFCEPLGNSAFAIRWLDMLPKVKSADRWATARSPCAG